MTPGLWFLVVFALVGSSAGLVAWATRHRATDEEIAIELDIRAEARDREAAELAEKKRQADEAVAARQRQHDAAAKAREEEDASRERERKEAAARRLTRTRPVPKSFRVSLALYGFHVTRWSEAPRYDTIWDGRGRGPNKLGTGSIWDGR